MPCPHCAATATSAQARRTALGYRTFRCRACRRIGDARTGTPYNHVQYPTDLVLLVVPWRLRDKLRLRDLAELFPERGFVFGHEAPPRPGNALRAAPGWPATGQAARAGRHEVARGEVQSRVTGALPRPPRTMAAVGGGDPPQRNRTVLDARRGERCLDHAALCRRDGRTNGRQQPSQARDRGRLSSCSFPGVAARPVPPAAWSPPLSLTPR